MKLNELIKKRSDLIEQMDSIVKELETKERSFNDEEKEKYESLDKEQKELENQINIRKQQDELNKEIVERELNNNKIDNKNMKFRNFKNEIVQRSGDYVNNFKVRAIELSSNIYDEKVGGGLSVVGYEPLYKQMGVQVLPNLTSALKLPYISAMKASKKAQGARNNNANAVATVDLTPARFPITETIGKELLAVGNEEALQAFVMEMVKACDRGVTEEIYKVAAAGATAVTVSGYTTADFDKIVGAVDGDVTVLMPRSDFYAAKSVKIDDGSGRFLVEKTSNTEGKLWDGTSLFYSNLFDGTAIVAADLQHITVGEFGDEYEVIFDYTSKAPEGQVVITVVKVANVVLRNANAVAKAVISA